MRWTKLGKVFDPTQQRLPHQCVDFAQSPQALVFDDFVRIYFSTRSKDHLGKYLSHVAYVDMNKTFTEILSVSQHTIVPLGEPGCYDEHGIFPFNVLRHDDRVLGYIGGWSRRVSVDIETSIGLAISSDEGRTFTKHGAGPVLTSSLREPFLVGDPFVTQFDKTFHMWYIYGTQWIKNPVNRVNERVYKIGHATSQDGISWIKTGKQIIPDRLNEYECQALPSVIHHDNSYHMVFCYRYATDFRENRTRGYRLGYAHSKNLHDWVRDDRLVGIDLAELGWDSEMMCYPHLFECDRSVYLLYNGNSFGKHGFGVAVLEEW